MSIQDYYYYYWIYVRDIENVRHNDWSLAFVSEFEYTRNGFVAMRKVEKFCTTKVDYTYGVCCQVDGVVNVKTV